MKNRRTGIRIVISLCAALSWWGFLYPELVLTPDTVTVKTEAEDGTFLPLPGDWTGDERLYFDLLNAKEDEITFRSRLWMNLSKFWEAFHDREAD